MSAVLPLKGDRCFAVKSGEGDRCWVIERGEGRSRFDEFRKCDRCFVVKRGERSLLGNRERRGRSLF
jgi:hypothetical protein